MNELSPAQTRQYIDAEATLRARNDARRAFAEVRGSMFWRELGGRRYLIRVSTTGAQTSLGPETPELQDSFSRFMQRKESATARLKSLSEALIQHQRSNRALRVGRAPRLLIDTLNRLEQTGLGQHFMVVGTHALYAYESACGVRVEDDATATRDIDLLLDTRKYLSFVTTMERLDTSLLQVLQKVDKTFELRPDQLYTAVNSEGFEIDVVRRAAKNDDHIHFACPNSKKTFGRFKFPQVPIYWTAGTSNKWWWPHPGTWQRCACLRQATSCGSKKSWPTCASAIR